MLARLLAVLVLVVGCRAASAQEAWVFTSEIPCATAPVYGVPFSRCWISAPRTFRIGKVQAWRLTFADQKSEFAAGLYRIIEAGSGSGFSPVTGAGLMDWIRTADTLRDVTSGGTGWASNGNYVTFQKPSRQCAAFVRNAPAINGQVSWLLGAAFCRESATPIAASEAQFVSDTLRVRN